MQKVVGVSGGGMGEEGRMTVAASSQSSKFQRNADPGDHGKIVAISRG